MKTYKQTIEKPCLEIYYDQFADNPRKDDYNLGYFITVDEKHSSPDDRPDIENIIKTTADGADNTEAHMNLIKQSMPVIGEKVIAIYPVVKYEHGGVAYSLGTKKGFDYSNNGFYIVTKQSAERIDASPKDFERIIEGELEIYNQYANGEVYCVTLRDEDGEIIEDVGNLYGLDSVRDGLPAEYANEDLSKYIIK